MMDQKRRDACFCDCRNKKVPNLRKLKTTKIAYEDENSILPSGDDDDHYENEFLPENKNNDPVDGCACTCHGMYEENQVYKSPRLNEFIFTKLSHSLP